jgi:hypothetical protein
MANASEASMNSMAQPHQVDIASRIVGPLRLSLAFEKFMVNEQISCF